MNVWKPWLKMIIWVIWVLRRTVVWDWRFDKLCGSHLQSQEDAFRRGCHNSPSQDSKHPDDLFQSRYYFFIAQNSIYGVQVRVGPLLPTTLGCGVQPQWFLCFALLGLGLANIFVSYIMSCEIYSSNSFSWHSKHYQFKLAFMKWIIGFQRQCRQYYVQGAVGDTSVIVSESVNGHISFFLHCLRTWRSFSRLKQRTPTCNAVRMPWTL